MKFLAVKNFDRFQHYRDRNPPWIKLYGDVLVDSEFLQLPESAQAQLMKLWILASQVGHPMPNNPRLLAGKIGTTGKFHLAALIDAGFLIPCNEFASTDASGALAESEQDDTPSVRARNQRSEDVVDEEISAAPVGEPALSALYLTIWSNKAVTERWGEQPSPYIPTNAIALADALKAKGIEWQVAKQSIYDQCRGSKQDRPPRGPNYFRRGIEESWAQELSRRATARSTDAAPAVSAKAEHWKDKEKREANEKHDRQTIFGNVNARKAKIDGDAWWRRMQRDSGHEDGMELYRYAAQHLNDSPRAGAA